MPTLPQLSVQILRGINGNCTSCGTAIDRRSKRCRKCNQKRLMAKRFPVEKRRQRICKDCGGVVSYQSLRGEGRCRFCYHASRRMPFLHKDRRLADRPFSGTSYTDKDGQIHFAEESLNEYFTVPAAWACLRKCWKGYKIAKSHGSYDEMTKYAGRIFAFQMLLNIPLCDFPELGLWFTQQ